jgi:hypothetical protein
VLVLGTLRLRGTGSGAVADTPFGLVTEFEHGVATRQFLWTGSRGSVGVAARRPLISSRTPRR